MSERESRIGRKQQPDEVQISAEELQALQRNDGQVWGEVFDRYNARLTSLAAKRIGRDNAEDVVQDVWVRFQEQVQKGTLQPDKLSHYLSRAVSNRTIDYLRHENKIHMHSLEDTFTDTNDYGYTSPVDVPDQRTNVEEEVMGKGEHLLGALPKILGDDDRAAAVFLASQDIKDSKIADLQGVPRGTILSRVYRGRKNAMMSLEMIADATDIPVTALEERKRKVQASAKKRSSV
jgi:RNA polymerase sigma factor (sigma-70 family)